jgi:putative ABC transport system permease protein
MRLRTLFYFYVRRLRTHPVQEALAALGIAIGVALAFAVMVANSSVTEAADEIVQGVTGSAELQVTARDGRGFDERVLHSVRSLPGVAEAAPLLEQRAVLVGPQGAEAGVTMASLDPSLAQLSGGLTRSFVPGGLQIDAGGIVLPAATAAAIGVGNPATDRLARPLPRIEVHVRGRAFKVTVAAVLGSDTLGPLTGAKVAVMPLRELQRIAGVPRRLTRILVRAEPGLEESVRRKLVTLAADRLTVADADADMGLLRQATGPTNQVTGFFATISALLGLLLAFNAMLLTAPERRRLVAGLRLQGYRPRQVVVLMLFQAAMLGIVASVVGVLAGWALSKGFFSQSPDYLAPGFTLGSRTIVGHGPLVLALCGGILASCLAASPPLLDLRRRRAVDAVFHESGVPGHSVGRETRYRMLASATALFIAATAVLIWAPRLALLASALLAVATLLAIPTTFVTIVRLADGLIERVPRLSRLTMAVLALRATTVRSLALAATGAVAVFGTVAIGGARQDLLRGISNYANDYVGTADLWVVNPADNQATKEIRAAGVQSRIESVQGVAAVRSYQGGFLDMSGRRVWIIARSPRDRSMIPGSQIVRGDLATATARLRDSGWAVVSEHLADAQGVSLGETIVLPTPTGPSSYRVAATTTNLGWTPGAIMMNGRDFNRAWGRRVPTAIEVDVQPDADPTSVQTAIEQAIGPASGLRVQTSNARSTQINASARQGLERLGQINVLLLAAAVLAMAAAMGTAIWQRRPALAAMRIQSFRPRQLWLLLLLEASVVLGAGSLTGALGGMYGQLGADRFLAIVTGFPVAPVPAGWQTVETFGLVVLAAVAIVAVPGWFASRVPPRLGLGSE